jgi:hypothetical protein
MSIRKIFTDITGQGGIFPRIIHIECDDSLATITTAGYLQSSVAQGYVFYPNDIAAISYGTDSATSQFFTLSFSGTTITLQPSAGDVVLPVVSGNFAVFAGTAGNIDDAGYSPSDATKTEVVMASAAVIANHIACFSDTAGTVNDDSATAINGGNIQAGLSGTAGTLASFPATAAKGSLKLVAVANTGDTATTISNAAMGQATVLTIPDPVAATANIVTAPAALVNNNLVKASGTAGLVVDAGARLIANTTAVYGGGGTSNAFTATGLTVASVGSAVIRASTNAVSIAKALPGTDTLTITFSADPGAGTTVDYIYSTAAQA